MKEIELSKTSKKDKGKYKALVDDDLFDEVNKYGWTYKSNGYARRTDRSTGKQKTIHLHRYIYELKFGDIPDNKEVEHIDRNKLNCQISNLRLATHAENCRNRSKYKTNTSGYIGVHKKVNEYKDKNPINEYWLCQWTDDSGNQRGKHFSYDEVGKVRAARYYDLMTSQAAGTYTGELNFQSLSEYQKELSKAILKDVEKNS